MVYSVISVCQICCWTRCFLSFWLPATLGMMHPPHQCAWLRRRCHFLITAWLSNLQTVALQQCCHSSLVTGPGKGFIEVDPAGKELGAPLENSSYFFLHFTHQFLAKVLCVANLIVSGLTVLITPPPLPFLVLNNLRKIILLGLLLDLVPAHQSGVGCLKNLCSLLKWVACFTPLISLHAKAKSFNDNCI